MTARSLLICAIWAVVTVKGVDVSLSSSPPSNAASLHPALISFSLEQDRWTDWAGLKGKPNKFWLNALSNLRDLTGVPPHVRVGANTEDRTNFDFGTEYNSNIYPAYTATTPYPEAVNVTVGDGYYQLSENVLPGTHMTWGLNLGRNNITAAYLMAQSILKAFKSSTVVGKGIVLDFLEIGNEPDLYKNNGLRNSSYSSQNYVSEWTQFATNVTDSFNLASTNTRWLGASFAGSNHAVGSGFSPQAIFAEGILDSKPGSLIKTISQHRYSASFCSGNGALLQELMRKKNIRGNLTDLIPDMQASRARGLDYIGGEMNSISCHGAPGVSNTAGAALWTLDYSLYASFIGISQVFFHEGIGFKYNLIQPVALSRSITDGTPLDAPLPPHVQPQYYGAIIANEAIGNSGSARSSEISIDDPYLSGYAIYEQGRLARAVLINSKAWLKSDEGSRNRSVTHVDLQGVQGQFSVKRLAINFADDTEGLSWAGRSFETSNAKPRGTEKADTYQVTDGVNLQETEAVLLTFL